MADNFRYMFSRLINPNRNNSFFLFGARGTGKSTFLDSLSKSQNVLKFDLLDVEQENIFLTRPQEFKEIIQKKLNEQSIDWIIVDEIQKCPDLLNYIHLFIEEKKIKFAMSGSSARRLKQKGVNLLAGRAFIEKMFPLTYIELDSNFFLQDALSWGTLPRVVNLRSSAEKKEYLKAYSLTYIQNEIQAEQWVRNLVPFRKFLPIAAQMNGKILNYSKIANDIGIDFMTVKNYFDILEDTMIGFRLDAFDESIRKRQRQGPKFYLFDLGFKRALENSLDMIPVPYTSYYGECFEHFVILEIHRLLKLKKIDKEEYYLRTKNGVEIDLILKKFNEPYDLIEIKSTDHVTEDDVRSLEKIGEQINNSRKILLSRDKTPKKIGSVDVLPWDYGIKEIVS